MGLYVTKWQYNASFVKCVKQKDFSKHQRCLLACYKPVLKKKKQNAIYCRHCGGVLFSVSAVQFGFLGLWFNLWGWDANTRNHGFNQGHADLLVLNIGVI